MNPGPFGMVQTGVRQKSSHLHRIRQVVEVSREFGRRVVPLGRRMAESVRLGLETGQLPFSQAMFVAPAEALQPTGPASIARPSCGGSPWPLKCAS